MEGIGNYIQAQIKAQKATKKAISAYLGITRQGFDKMLINESMTIKVYEQVCRYLSIDPCGFFREQTKVYDLSMVADPQTEYRRDKIDTKFDIIEINREKDLINYQAKQIDRLTRIIEKLMDKLDTRINPS